MAKTKEVLDKVQEAIDGLDGHGVVVTDDTAHWRLDAFVDEVLKATTEELKYRLEQLVAECDNIDTLKRRVLEILKEEL